MKKYIENHIDKLSFVEQTLYRIEKKSIEAADANLMFITICIFMVMAKDAMTLGLKLFFSFYFLLATVVFLFTYLFYSKRTNEIWLKRIIDNDKKVKENVRK